LSNSFYNRGISLGRLGRYEDLIASYNKVLDSNPDDHQAWYNRGNELSRLGQYEEAIDSYNKGLDICYFLLQNNIEPSLTHLSKSIELDDRRKLVIANGPDFATLHNDSRFQALLDSTD
jgi:tetratricopeptide (TPR) repeat protein